MSAIESKLKEFNDEKNTLQHRKAMVEQVQKILPRAKPGIDLSRAHSDIQRDHDRPGSAPRHIRTPVHTPAQMRKAVEKGPKASEKKVQASQKKHDQISKTHDKLGEQLEIFNRIPASPQKKTVKNELESLLERYTHRKTLDRNGYNDLVQNIDQLMPNIGLQLVRPKNINLTSEDHLKLDRILQEMKPQIKKEQLVSILKVLQVSDMINKDYQTLQSLLKRKDKAARDKRGRGIQLAEARSLHRHAEGFHAGKGKLLKLLKPSKKRPKKRAKKKAPKKELEQVRERIGPFRL